jgi:hypothetical protein
MAFFEDLTPYSYHRPEEELPGTLNVGWLDRTHPSPTGQTDEAFRGKLGRLCQRRVKRTRGFHPCPFCTGRGRPHSSSEMRVSGGGKVYAAPSLVHHYVVAHGRVHRGGPRLGREPRGAIRRTRPPTRRMVLRAPLQLVSLMCGFRGGDELPG